jgi:Flp pilus assembly protein TadG
MTARTVADLVSQAANINNADMTNSLNAAAAVMAPFPVANLKVTVSSVKIDASGVATIDWSDTLNGAAHSPGSPVTLPTALAIPNTWLIWGEVQYNYRPVIGYVVTGTLILKDQSYLAPRVSPQVTRSVN